MKNNLNKNTDSSQKKFKESLKSSNQNILYKSYNDKKNRLKENNNIINNQELSDIKSIVKNSVEKINDLFSLQEMKQNNSKILSRKSNEIKSIKNYFDKDNNTKNNIKTIVKCEEEATNSSSTKANKKIMKTNITFKINNYLNVLNKSKNCLNNAVNYRNYVNYGIYSDNSNSKNNIKNYLTQKNSNNDINNTNNTNINSTNINNTNLNNTSNKSHIGHNLNLKKNNKKKDIKKNNISNYKTNIKSNILMGIKNKKLNTKINNEYLFLSPKINKEKNKYYFFNEDLNGKNEEINNNLTEKSIVVNTRYKQNETNKKNYEIKPMKISHINKEIEPTITNENQSKDSKNKTNKSNKSTKSYNFEKRKKFIFLKRAKTKSDINENLVKKKKKKLIFSQKNSKKKYQLANSRINNYYNTNFYHTGDGFYPKKRDKFDINSDVDNDDALYINEINDYINRYNECENRNINNNSQQKDLNNKVDNELNYNYSLSNGKSNKNGIVSITKEDKFIQTTSRLENINNLLISPASSGSGLDSEYKISHHLSKKCKSDNKLKISKKYNNKNNKETSTIFLNLESKGLSRNINSYVSSISNNCKKGNKILNLIEKKNLFNSSNKKVAELERNNMRKTLKKIYDTPFPNKVATNDVLKLFLLLNEYIINNNLLSDYNFNNNKDLLNKLSELLSNYSFINYPKEYDINIDTYIKSVKAIQRAWRKKKVKQFLGGNEEIHELKKIMVNKYITKVGYKMKKIFGLFHSMIEDFNNIENSDDINRMFYYVKNLIKRDLTIYEKNLIYKEFINNFLNLK